jgi:serine/threonine protein kinase
VEGLCKAVDYLHNHCGKVILHRDIKPTNILLDSDFNAKLGDFGLSRVVQDSEKKLMQTRAIGTVEYMDPLCMKDGKIDFGPSSDAYSVGIVLLEIVHGKYDMDRFRKLRTDRRGTFLKDFADPKLAGIFNEKQMERVIDLGLKCSEPDDASKRPLLNGATLAFLQNGGELRTAASSVAPVPTPPS